MYSLLKDIKEEHDVAEEYPDVVPTIEAIMERKHVASSVDRFKIPQLGYQQRRMGDMSQVKSRKPLHLLVIPAFLGLMLAGSCTTSGPPPARIQVVKDEIHGVEVADPYRWLENWDDPEVKAWSESQNAYARKALDGLPSRTALSNRISEVLGARSDSYYNLTWRHGLLFAMKQQPPLNQPLLVVIPSVTDLSAERVILDPNKLDTTGSVSIDWFVPSPDGRRVAASLSSGGSEVGNVHLFMTADGTQVDEVIPRVNGGTAGGDLAWGPDGSGYYYTRYPREGERPPEDMNFYQQLWYRELGSPVEADRPVLGEDFPKTAEIRVSVAHSSGHVLVTMQLGDSGQFAHYLKMPQGEWRRLARFEDQVVFMTFGPSDTLFLISRKGTPRGTIQKLALSDPDLAKAVTIVAEGESTIVSDFYGNPTMVATEERLFVTYQLGGPSEIRAFDHDGRQQAAPAVEPVSAVYELEPLEDNDILYRTASYLEPPSWRRFNGDVGSEEATLLVNQAPVDFSDCEVVRSFAKSKDGTSVPVNIVHQKGIVLDGSHPALLTGYGGFGVSRSPAFDPLRKVWIEQGGVFAEANIRGGGEFGESWHRDGMLTKKQNCFDDFAAVMSQMVESGYTNRQRLGIYGGSNGGLLMGAMITQHPKAAQAVVSAVGIYDMLRNELTPNGAYNIPEYGTVQDPDQFKALLAYSPYHNVEPHTAYPAILFMTGANDPRVDPMHSRKMTARLQASTSGTAPILLRTSSGTGHGLNTPLSERIEEAVDMYGFLFQQLGVAYKPVQ